MYIGNIYQATIINQSKCPLDFCWLDIIIPDCPPNSGCGEQTCKIHSCGVY